MNKMWKVSNSWPDYQEDIEIQIDLFKTVSSSPQLLIDEMERQIRAHHQSRVDRTYGAYEPHERPTFDLDIHVFQERVSDNTIEVAFAYYSSFDHRFYMDTASIYALEVL